MRSTMMALVLLVVAATASPLVTAGNSEPLELSPAEALKLWTPVEGEFHPRVPASPRKVAFADEVTVAYTVTARGRTKDVQVIEAKPAGTSSRWALNAVRAMRFDPTESNSARQPIRSQMSTRWISSGR